MKYQLLAAFPTDVLKIGVVVIIFVAVMFLILLLKCYKKVPQGKALVRNGIGGTLVRFTGMFVVPIFHRVELMDISVKRIEIDRSAHNGLICKDNIRADIKVAFFVRVNPEVDAVKKVAQSIGTERASNQATLEHLFDAKFSEALKTVGKKFEFVELYEERDTFKEEILKVIGTDLNGYIMEDAAIDYLEQTKLSSMDPDNILDAEGIKKITERTAEQSKLTNFIARDKQRVIKQQDVEAREAILELERQLAETEAKQQREILTVQAREEAETAKVAEEQRQKSEQARIAAEEEIKIAEENKDRQVLVAMRNKERTDAVEIERVERDRMLEVIERNRVTELKDIERQKVVEVEKRDIQEVIKERVALEKTVVIEQQSILDTEAFAGADREKQVAVTLAEKDAQEALVRKIKEAEASKEAAVLLADQELYQTVQAADGAKQAAVLHAEEIVIKADAAEAAAEKESSAKKMLADATAAETAAPGLGQAQVLIAKAEATQMQGTAEAAVSKLKFEAEAEGITQKAGAMKLFEEAGQSHEEFKLELEKAKTVELAELRVQKDIAAEQAKIMAEALKSANIDIVGGETEFFDKITSAITTGKAIDRTVNNSKALTDVKETFFNGDPEYFKGQIKNWIDDFGITSEDMKNLSISAVIGKMLGASPDAKTANDLTSLLNATTRFGMAGEKADKVLKSIG